MAKVYLTLPPSTKFPKIVNFSDHWRYVVVTLSGGQGGRGGIPF